MSDYNDGKIHGWNGGECPVHPKSVVAVWVRCGVSDTGNAADFSWDHKKQLPDIIAFQVTKPYAEPKFIWVNEHHNGNCYGYPSEELAKSCACGSGTAVRIAVKYVEGKE